MALHPLRFAYALVLITSLIYFYMPYWLRFGTITLNKIVLIIIFIGWMIYELMFVDYKVEDLILFLFSFLSIPSLLLLSNGRNEGYALLAIYLAVGLYLNLFYGKGRNSQQERSTYF
jgi:hypothetical protein